MSKLSFLGVIFYLLSCSSDYKDNYILLNENFPIRFYEVSDCDQLDSKTYLNLNIVAKSNNKVVFSSEFQGLESINTFYFDTLLNSNLASLFKKLCVGDSVSFMLKSSDFYTCFFQKDTSVLFNSISNMDSLHINMKVVSSHDALNQNEFENELIKRAKEKEVLIINKTQEDWKKKFLDIFYFDNLFAVKVGQLSNDQFQNTDTSSQFIALKYAITDLNDRLIYQTSANSLEYYDKSLNDQLLEGFKILVNEYNMGDSVVAIVPSKMAFGNRGSFTNKIPPFTPLKIYLKIVQK